eukprot:1339830-Rhodomonas_salina.1
MLALAHLASIFHYTDDGQEGKQAQGLKRPLRKDERKFRRDFGADSESDSHHGGSGWVRLVHAGCGRRCCGCRGPVALAWAQLETPGGNHGHVISDECPFVGGTVEVSPQPCRSDRSYDEYEHSDRRARTLSQQRRSEKKGPG